MSISGQLRDDRHQRETRNIRKSQLVQLLRPARSFSVSCYCFGVLGSGGARRSASEITAIDRAPFFPTDRTAKK